VLLVHLLLLLLLRLLLVPWAVPRGRLVLLLVLLVPLLLLLLAVPRSQLLLLLLAFPRNQLLVVPWAVPRDLLLVGNPAPVPMDLLLPPWACPCRPVPLLLFLLLLEALLLPSACLRRHPWHCCRGQLMPAFASPVPALQCCAPTLWLLALLLPVMPELPC
jgi:hypothetical protein